MVYPARSGVNGGQLRRHNTDVKLTLCGSMYSARSPCEHVLAASARRRIRRGKYQLGVPPILHSAGVKKKKDHSRAMKPQISPV